jgi:AcrR family transcriptional regulator
VAERKPSTRPRVRRTAEAARAEILAIAERQLAKDGPDAIRLTAIANEMGVTHPAILRHFQSREALLEALLHHAGRRLRDTLVEAVADADDGELDVAGFFAALDRIYREQGYARLSAWLVLSGWSSRGSGMFREAAEALHEARAARGAKLEDTLFAIALANLVAWSEALAGPSFRRAVGLPGDTSTAARFRDWFAELLRGHLARPSLAPARSRRS